MRRFTAASIIAVTLMTIFSGSGIYCQEPDTKTFDGTVTAVDTQSSQISIQGAEAFTFSVAPGADITNADGFNIELSDVKIGSYATVDYYDDKSGKRILTGMEVEYRD